MLAILSIQCFIINFTKYIINPFSCYMYLFITQLKCSPKALYYCFITLFCIICMEFLNILYQCISLYIKLFKHRLHNMIFVCYFIIIINSLYAQYISKYRYKALHIFFFQCISTNIIIFHIKLNVSKKQWFSFQHMHPMNRLTKLLEFYL